MILEYEKPPVMVCKQCKGRVDLTMGRITRRLYWHHVDYSTCYALRKPIHNGYATREEALADVSRVEVKP